MKLQNASFALVLALVGCGTNNGNSTVKSFTQDQLKSATWSNGYLVCAAEKVRCDGTYTDSPLVEKTCARFVDRRAELDDKFGVAIDVLNQRLKHDNFRLAENTFAKGCEAGFRDNKVYGRY